MRKNLLKRMIDVGIDRNDIAKLLNISNKTAKLKISGEADFKWSEIVKIKNAYFKNDSFEELFKNETEPA